LISSAITEDSARISRLIRVDWIDSELERSIATISNTAPAATIMPIVIEIIISISEKPFAGDEGMQTERDLNMMDNLK
jgi:hypothetical protein